MTTKLDQPGCDKQPASLTARKLVRLFTVGTIVSSLLHCLTAAGAVARLTNSSPINGKISISWNSRGALETADQLSGPWTTITNASNPYTNTIAAGSRFFRLNQTVDTTTLRKKVLCGYQGWFRCPGDGGSQ